MPGCVTSNSSGARARLDPLADPRTGQEPELALRLGVLYADGRRARTNSTARYLSMKLTARICSCAKSAPAGPTANGMVASGFTRCHQTARSPSSYPGCCMRWPRHVQNWTAR